MSVILGIILGLIIIYIIGTLQFCLITKMSFINGLMACVLPFVLIDLIKVGLAYAIGSSICKRVNIGIRTC